jgi:hypothetical protein
MSKLVMQLKCLQLRPRHTMKEEVWRRVWFLVLHASFSALSVNFLKNVAQPKKMYAYCMMRNARVSLLVVIIKCIFVTFALACIIAMACLRLKRNRSIPLDQVSCSLESLPWEFRELNIIKVFYPHQGFVKRVE